REKLSAFEARRKKEGGGKVDKRSVQKYLKQQNNEESVNNALAEILKGLKFDNYKEQIHIQCEFALLLCILKSSQHILN
ncbi:hypothetical protein, partial [Lysinibacillus sphaericus]|uniref:hypothetical protein n=1 Tax=Lysinibacillus sphaericus TaxID=1421 RepID=UPI000559C28E